MEATLMQRRRLSPSSIVLTALLVALAALYLMPMLATAAGSKAKQTAYNKAVAQVTISLSGKGIVVTPKALKDGNYLLAVKNNTSDARGVEMIGIDSAKSPTVRYTAI